MSWARRSAASLPLFFAVACTAPDLGPSIKDAQTLLEASIATTEKPLQERAKLELVDAEAAMARTDNRIIALPTNCLRMNADLAVSVDECRIIDRATPLYGPVNATQVLLAQKVMLSYFAVLSDINSATSPADIRSKSTALIEAFDTFSKTQNGDALARLGANATRRGPALSAVAGFAAEQARIRAMRRIVTRADSVLEDLLRGIQPILVQVGDRTAVNREAAINAYAAYNAAKKSGNTAAELRAARETKAAFDRLHNGEAKSPLRQLYLVRDLNAAMLKALQASPSLDEIDKLTAQISEIATLLEDS